MIEVKHGTIPKRRWKYEGAKKPRGTGSTGHLPTEKMEKGGSF